MTPFGDATMMRSAFTKFLTAGRFSRAYYGWSKGLAFVFLAWMYAWEVAPERFLATVYDQAVLRGFIWFIVYSSVAICVIRGLPVFYDALYFFRAEEQRASRALDDAPSGIDIAAEQAERGGSIS
jgi:hypothetical protein